MAPTMVADRLEKMHELLTPAFSLHLDAWLTFGGAKFLSGAGDGGQEVKSRKLSIA